MMTNNSSSPQKLNPGGYPDTPDPRDIKWGEELGSALPPFDWNIGYDIEQELSTILGIPGFVLKPNDQNGSGSCGGQSWSKYAAVLKAVSTKTFVERSAKFIYSQTFMHVPGGGSAGRDDCNILRNQGCSSESLCLSYDNGQPPQEPFMERVQDITDAARADAKFDEALAYANVPLNIDSFAQAMASNHGMVIGLKGTDAPWQSVYPTHPSDADVAPGGAAWGHWIYGGKAMLVNGVKMIGVLNSWGSRAGENGNGWQWLSEDYFAEGGAFLMSGWTHILNANPTPTPAGFKYNFAADISFGATSEDAKALQQALQIDGEFPANISPTGYYGSATATAVLAFQLKYNIAPQQELSGLQGKSVGVATRAQLNTLFNK
jgi:hypothetical protein